MTAGLGPGRARADTPALSRHLRPVAFDVGVEAASPPSAATGPAYWPGPSRVLSRFRPGFRSDRRYSWNSAVSSAKPRRNVFSVMTRVETNCFT